MSQILEMFLVQKNTLNNWHYAKRFIKETKSEIKFFNNHLINFSADGYSYFFHDRRVKGRINRTWKMDKMTHFPILLLKNSPWKKIEALFYIDVNDKCGIFINGSLLFTYYPCSEKWKMLDNYLCDWVYVHTLIQRIINNFSFNQVFSRHRLLNQQERS